MFKAHHLMPDVVGRQDPTVLFEMLDALSEENNNSGGNTTQNNRTVADTVPYRYGGLGTAIRKWQQAAVLMQIH